MSISEMKQETMTAIYDHVETLVRTYITSPTDFLIIRSYIDEKRKHLGTYSDVEHIQAIKDLMEVAIKNNAPVAFFRKLSEARLNGSIWAKEKALLLARLGLIYYFELLSSEADYSDLQAFRERAISLKNSTQSLIDLIQKTPMTFKSTSPYHSACKTGSKLTLIAQQRKIMDMLDNFIRLMGQSVEIQPTYKLNGSWNALVASYTLYGNVGKAYDILTLSNGVSGAKLNGVSYYRNER